MSERRCIAMGQSGGKESLIRFVIAPDGTVTTDLAEKLPGRGIWVSATRDALASVIKRKLFARAARRSVTVPADMVERLEASLLDRAVAVVGLARRAGLMVAGQAKVEAALRQRRVAVRLEAGDGAIDGRRKFDRLAADVPVLTTLLAEELALAFDKDHVVHAAMFRETSAVNADQGLVGRLTRDFDRLAGFRLNLVGAGLENSAGRCIEATADIRGEGRAVTE
jgi:predicted RNA-binding protein YlxR (DUF448 family)